MTINMRPLGGGQWQLVCVEHPNSSCPLNCFAISIYIKRYGCWVHFPGGVTWNLASVPRPARMFIDNDEIPPLSTLFHDQMYRHHGCLPESWCARKFTRSEIDLAWRDLMLDDEKFSGVKAYVAYGVVRSVGWLAYAKGCDL